MAEDNSGPRVLELRVHGVGNPPPPDALSAAGEQVKRVAGDDSTGFWRLDPPPAGEVVTEAYSWGQLTSGRPTGTDLRRALWMALLPFLLANVAFWARREVPADPGRDRPWPPTPAGVAGYLLRLLCLSLTGALALTATGAGADLIGWQCAGGCPARIPGLGFLGAGWWGEGARPLAVGLLAPVALLAGLWLLGRRTFQYEACVAHADLAGAASAPSSQLDSPAYWQGDGQVRRLSMLHLAFGGAAAGLVVLGATLALDSRLQAWLDWPLLGALAVALLSAVVMLGLPGVVGRGDDRGYGWTLLPLALAAAGVLGAGLRALLADPAGIANAAAHPTLPVYGGALAWLFAAQFLALLAVAGLMRWGWPGLTLAGLALAALVLGRFSWWAGVELTPGQRFAGGFAVLASAALAVVAPWRRRAGGGLSDPAWHGQAAALLAGLGWLLCALYSAAALFRLADYLNGGEPTTSDRRLHLPTALAWSAIGLTVVVVVAAAGALAAWETIRRDRAQLIQDWAAGKDNLQATAHQRWRFGDVAAAQAAHRFVERRGLGFLGWLTIPLIVVLAAGVAGGLSADPPAKLLFASGGRPNPVVAWLSDAGATLAALLFAGLAALGYLAYRSDGARRTIGIVWDLGTFWPRSAHPFAPPCYAERVVPQLVTRICNLPDHDGGAGIILAGHSQGSAIATAAVRQLPPERRQRVFLLTFGTQLNRLFGRIFPAFFSPVQLADLASRLGPPSTEPRWRSLHRLTDPMGFPVGVSGPGWSVDIQLEDPHGLAPAAGEVLDPKICGHSDYPSDPAYLAVRDQAAADLLRVPPAAGTPVTPARVGVP